MKDNFEMLTYAAVIEIPLSSILAMYNNAVEEIWCLKQKLYEERALCSSYAEAYDELLDKTYG